MITGQQVFFVLLTFAYLIVGEFTADETQKRADIIVWPLVFTRAIIHRIGEIFIGESRDCHSPSCSDCEKCNTIAYPNGYEEHFEWETDKSGNLINE